MLNPDGTPLRDAAGKMIDTHTNDDIQTFARAWTGHDLQPWRVNIEANDVTQQVADKKRPDNSIDPMRIRPEWRDPFPKLDLLGGYIGDGHPLCTGLPDQGWLRRGAKFLYRGGRLTAELEESFDSFLTLDDGGSDLFQALY